ncbi:MAG: VWA domain-containing protein [Phycisphaerales bacterium]|nr:VWA domain-containing protein [Phycisphaerales bacterium]
MTDCNLADITLVIDRSGSMSHVRAEAESGVNAFIREQAAARGQANLTLVQFDTEYDFVHRGMPIGDVPPYTLEPRGCTALLDAVGRAITEAGQRLAALPEEARPGLVVFAIVTDGHENSSREFTRQQVRDMITHQRQVYNWQFVFLCVDDKAFDEAVDMGVDPAATSKYEQIDTSRAYSVLSRAVSRGRTSAMAHDRQSIEILDSERQELQPQPPSK